jgi:serine-type D-Ala-D-Ala carboxypeptidase/endopeptidase
MPLDKWAPLRKQLDGWQFTNNFAVNVGDETGPLFSYSHGNLTVHTPVLTFSTSKWPMAMMVLGLVADGTIASLDDRVNKYLKWWSNSTDELKSRITVRQLLSFTSGFGGGSAGSEELTNTCMDNTSLPLAHDYMACAQHLYETTNLTGLPGLAFSYNSFHLQFAGAVAVAASGLNIQQVLNKYFYAPCKHHRVRTMLRARMRRPFRTWPPPTTFL